MWYMNHEYIIKVADTRSISQASKELYISQPALTKYINKIEQELGIKLFNRNTIPISLTYAGERFVIEARKILEMQRRLEKEMEDLCEMKKGRLNIGVTSSRGEYWLPIILPKFKKEYPGIELKILEGKYDYLEENIEKEYLDLALITAPMYTENLEKVVLTKERIFLVLSERNHLLEGIDLSDNCLENPVYINPERLTGEDMISYFSGLGITRDQQRILQKYDIKPNIVLETGNVDTAYCLACANLGFAFVPETCVIDSFPQWLPVLCKVEDHIPTRDSVAIYKKGRPLTAAARGFIEMAKEILTSDCPAFKSPTMEDYIVARSGQNKEKTITEWLNEG